MALFPQTRLRAPAATPPDREALAERADVPAL